MMMQDCVGLKLIRAVPMTRQAYNDYRGWKLPEDEDGADDGFLVEYLDGGKPNDARHEGYISWSPEPQFRTAYRPTVSMGFEGALFMLKRGHRVARAGWNGKNMWLTLVGPADYNVHGAVPALGLEKWGWIGMKAVDGRFGPWLASQTDMLALDWSIVE